MIEEIVVDCPYCGEHAALDVDTTAGAEQSYFEDCPVCCRPIRLRLQAGHDGELLGLDADRDE
jgi:hypothetical protein